MTLPALATLFLDPLPGFSSWWWLSLLPLAVLVGVGYKAARPWSLPGVCLAGCIKGGLAIAAYVVALLIVVAALLWGGVVLLR